MDIEPIDILLVEDNPNDVELALRALKKSGLANNIFVVTDGQEALDYLYRTGPYENRNLDHNPKVVLLDLKLPRVNGLEVLKILKTDPHKKMIPVVVMTSSVEEKDLVESYELGVNSYILKPVDFDRFIEAVKNIGVYWLMLNRLPKL